MTRAAALALGVIAAAAGCAVPDMAGGPPERFCPDFSLDDLDGRRHRLYETLREGPVLLWFTNLCPGCMAKFPLVERLAREHRGRLGVYAISVLGGDRDTPARARDDQQPSFPLLLDPADWVGTYLGYSHPADVCPVHNAIIVRPGGAIAWRGHLSAAADEEVEAAIRVLL